MVDTKFPSSQEINRRRSDYGIEAGAAGGNYRLPKPKKAPSEISPSTEKNMHRSIWISLAAVALGGCAVTNDSGVELRKKPDLSGVAPGTPVSSVSGLDQPIKKEAVPSGELEGSQIWLFEWDLADDGVNNRMFTSVVVKDGRIVGYGEETPDKWGKNPQLHMMAKLDSAIEDMASLNATAARHQRMALARENYNDTQLSETWRLLSERSQTALQAGAVVPALPSVDRNWEVRPYGRQVGPVGSVLAAQSATVTPVAATMPAPPTSVPAPAAAPASSIIPAPVMATSESATEPVAPKKTLRQLEAEELRIRKDSSLTKKERMRRLHEIWKQQREVMAESAG